MTSTQVVETSVSTNNSPSRNTKTRTTDQPTNMFAVITDMGNKNNLRTIEAQIVQKLMNNEAGPKFTVLIKKKACAPKQTQIEIERRERYYDTHHRRYRELI